MLVMDRLDLILTALPAPVIASTALILRNFAVVTARSSRTRAILDTSTGIGKAFAGHLVDAGLESCNFED